MTEHKEGKVGYKFEQPDKIRNDVLEAIPYEYGDRRDIDITIKQPEFTSLCPMTGLPDFGCITIRYRPARTLVELKSLKFYLLQYRNVGVFYEHVVNRILDDLVNVVEPKRMEIIGDFTARGGITTQVIAVYEGNKDAL